MDRTKRAPEDRPLTTPEHYLFSGHDNDIVGSATFSDSNGRTYERVIYDGNAIIKALMKRDGMDEQDAHEWVSSQMEGGFVGPNGPVVMWPYNPDESPLDGDDR